MSKKDVGLFARPCWADTKVDRRFLYLMDYLDWMGDEVVSHAKAEGMEVHDKTGDNAKRANIERQLRDVDPIFFFHASHGGDNVLTGQDMTNLVCCKGKYLCSKPNHKVLSDRVVYTLSCLSAKELGPAVIQADGISYIGYEEPLTICLVERKDADAAFKDIWTSGAKDLIRGKTTGEAYDKIKQRYQAYIDYWELRPRDWLRPTMLKILRWNLQNLRLLGRKDATIRIVDGVPPMVNGTVIGKSTEEPIPSATVITDNCQSTTTDASGKYKLAGVLPGYRVVAAFKPGYEGAYRCVAVKEEGVTTADLALLPCEVTPDELVIADCAKDLGFFDQECNGYPIIDKDELYNGTPTCKAIDTCGIQAHAGYYVIGSGGKEFKVDIDKHPLLHLTMKAEEGTDTCLLLVIHDKESEDRIFVIVGKTPSGSHGSGVPVGKGCFRIEDDGEWHDYTYDLRNLRDDYPPAQTVRIVQFYSSKSCNGIDHAFHFSILVAKA